MSGLEREQPQRKVYLSEYTIAKYTVTNRQFKAFVDKTGYRTERELDGLGKSIWYKLREAPLGERLDHPVVCVTRKDALAYCEWFSQETGASKSAYRPRHSGRKQREAATAGFGPGGMNLMKPSVILCREGHDTSVGSLSAGWIALWRDGLRWQCLGVVPRLVCNGLLRLCPIS